MPSRLDRTNSNPWQLKTPPGTSEYTMLKKAGDWVELGGADEQQPAKEGTVEALVNGDWVKLGAGSVIFQASCIDHAIRNVGETPATYHVIKWNSPGMLKQLAEAKAAAKAAEAPSAK